MIIFNHILWLIDFLVFANGFNIFSGGGGDLFCFVFN